MILYYIVLTINVLLIIKLTRDRLGGVMKKEMLNWMSMPLGRLL